jgi:hypothetical protein
MCSVPNLKVEYMERQITFDNASFSRHDARIIGDIEEKSKRTKTIEK